MRIVLLTLILLVAASLIGPSMNSQPKMADMFLPTGTLTVQAAAQTPVARNSTIYVGVTGFNSTYKAGLRLTVNESDIVTLRFIYNDTAWPTNNPHKVCIDGYNVCSQIIDRNNLESVISFTANIVGQLSFKCTELNCDAHGNLLAGVLDVRPFGGGAWIRTTLHLAGEVRTHSPPEIILSAHIVDVNNSVVPGVPVLFYRNSTWGFAELGSATTNSSGLAALTYAPPSNGDIVFKAVFGGTGIYLASSSDPIQIYFSAPADSQGGFPYAWGQNPSVDLRAVGVPPLSALLWIGIVFSIIGSVWTTYLYVGKQIAGIWRESGRRPSQASELKTGDAFTGLQAQVKRTSYPLAIMMGLGMTALGYADFLLLTLFAPNSSLVIFPLLAIAEAFLVARLFRSLS